MSVRRVVLPSVRPSVFFLGGRRRFIIKSANKCTQFTKGRDTEVRNNNTIKKRREKKENGIQL